MIAAVFAKNQVMGRAPIWGLVVSLGMNRNRDSLTDSWQLVLREG